MGTMSWSELGNRVRTLAIGMRQLGVRPGDRIVSYMANTPETMIAMLASVAIGAIWSAAVPEFGARTVIDRFGQIQPTIAFVADGYAFDGRQYDRRGEIEAIVEACLPSAVVLRINPLPRGVARANGISAVGRCGGVECDADGPASGGTAGDRR